MIMKLGKKIYIVILLVMLLLAYGCKKQESEQEQQNNETEYNIEFDVNKFSEPLQLNVDFVGEEEKYFNNNGNNISTTLKLETNIEKLDIGVLFFADGILQPASFKDGTDKELNIVTIGESTEFPFSFDLISGKSDEKVRIDTLTLLNPTLKISKDTNAFGNNFGTSNPFPNWVTCNKTVETYTGISKFDIGDLLSEVKEQYIHQNSDGTVDNGLLTSMNARYYQDGQEVNKLSIADNKLSFDMKISGGQYTEYNIYIFLNNKVLNCFEGKKYNIVTINSDKTTTISMEADITGDDLNEYGQLFAVAVPTSNVKDIDTSIYKLPNIVVVNK